MISNSHEEILKVLDFIILKIDEIKNNFNTMFKFIGIKEERNVKEEIRKLEEEIASMEQEKINLKLDSKFWKDEFFEELLLAKKNWLKNLKNNYNK